MGVKLQIIVHSEPGPLTPEAVKTMITLLTLGIKQSWFSHNLKIWVGPKKQKSKI